MWSVSTNIGFKFALNIEKAVEQYVIAGIITSEFFSKLRDFKAIVKASEYDTTLVYTTLSNTERVFKNECALEVRKREKEKERGEWRRWQVGKLDFFGYLADVWKMFRGYSVDIYLIFGGFPMDGPWTFDRFSIDVR